MDSSCRSTHFRIGVSYSLLIIGYLLVSGCSQSIHLGVGGKYTGAKIEIQRGRSADLDKAIAALEYVVQEDPTYRDSLTLLGRAYYQKRRYQDAYLILQRALIVDREDYIAWLFLGLSQLQLGQDEAGLNSIKGGLTLLLQWFTEQDGHQSRGRRRTGWDVRGAVKSSLRRAVFQARKGLDEKRDLIRSVQKLIPAIDEEEFYDRIEQKRG